MQRKRQSIRSDEGQRLDLHQWASVGKRLTFRAELMPGRSALERTFTVASVVSRGRVELKGIAGQHAEAEFEPARRAH